MKPETRLNTVVLPAPLGPMSEVIEPSATAKVASFTAATPPKDLATPLTSSSTASYFSQQQLAPVAEDALRAQRHEQHQQ